MIINPTNRDKNWQKKALVTDDTATIILVSRTQTISKGSSLKTQGSKAHAWQGRMVQGSKDGTLSVCGENVLGKSYVSFFSSRTSKASCLGGLNRFKREGATILKGTSTEKLSPFLLKRRTNELANTISY